MSIDQDDISAARRVIAAASPEPKVWGLFRSDTHEGALEQFAENHHYGPPGPTHLVAFTRDESVPIETFALTMAITGNGPTSEANAKYIVGSFDPVVGWGACLDEIERLRGILIGPVKLRKA